MNMMTIKDITKEEKGEFNRLATHPLQSYEWGEFRKKTGIKVIRRGFWENNKLKEIFQLTIHQIPHTKWAIGYLPKGSLPTQEVLAELHKIGKENNCIFIQLEPATPRHSGLDPESIQNKREILKQVQDDAYFKRLGLRPAAHPLFTKYTFMLDLTHSEEEILKTMHSKTRYNIRVAQKHGVEVEEDDSDKAFDTFWKLTEETTKRQGFFAHTKNYHKLHWETFPHKTTDGGLSSHLFVGKYKGKILSTLLLLVFKDTLYYPYGASSNEERNVMHSTYTMWEAIKFGKKLGLKKFDMWGAANAADPTPDNPYYGFHRFKQGFGANLIEFVGSYDLIINPMFYEFYKIADKARALALHLKRM